MKTFYTLVLHLICFSAYAQKSDSTHTHFRIIRGGLIEHSTELKSIKNVKNGLSEITSGKVLLGTGMYKDGERVGRWRFFKNTDSLEQVYNYSTKKLEYNNTLPNVLYEIDSIMPGDKVIYPAKIGGFYTGLNFLTKKISPSKDFKAYPGVHPVFLIFHIDANGKLLKYEAVTGGDGYKKTKNMDLKDLKPEDFDFVPAYLNGKAVSSRLIFKGDLTID